MNLIVKLVTAPAPLLTVTPDDEGVPLGGSTTLTWMRDTTGANFEFSSTSISGLTNPCFSAPSYNSSNNTVSVTDSHAGASSQGSFNYTLSVASGGTAYHAGGNPVIVNR